MSLKKILGLICVLVGLPLVGLAVSLFVSKVLLLTAQSLSPIALVLGLAKNLILSGFIAFLGISFIRGGTFLFNYQSFSPDDIAFDKLNKIYKKEDLCESEPSIPDDSKYLKTKNIDLADIYQHIDSSKFPETHDDLLATIKARVEKA